MDSENRFGRSDYSYILQKKFRPRKKQLFLITKSLKNDQVTRLSFFLNANVTTYKKTHEDFIETAFSPGKASIKNLLVDIQGFVENLLLT